MKWRAFAVVFLVSLSGLSIDAALQTPPKPERYFNDYAKVTSEAGAKELNEILAQFERDTSNQVLVVVFNSLQDANLEEFAARTFKAWGVGQKDKNNGAVLFVFIQDRKLRIEVGYGLEGVLPDYLCKRIIEEKIKPSFKNGRYPAGLREGILGIIAATKGEYKGTGRTVAEKRHITPPTHAKLTEEGVILLVVVVGVPVSIFLLACLCITPSTTSRGRRRSRSTYSSGGISWGSGSSSWGSSSSSGSSDWGSSSSSSSSYSGGGGSSGGGGASGSW